MKGHDFLRGLNELDDDLIAEAAHPLRKKRKSRSNILKLAMAAVIILFLTGGILLQNTKQTVEKKPSPKGSTKENTEETVLKEGSSFGDEENAVGTQSSEEEALFIPWYPTDEVYMEMVGDMDGDGREDSFALQTSEDKNAFLFVQLANGNVYRKDVEIAEGNVYYYMYSEGNREYFLEFDVEDENDGTSARAYYLYQLSEDGSETIIESETIKFSRYSVESDTNIEEMAQFFVNLYIRIEQSSFLIASRNGEACILNQETEPKQFIYEFLNPVLENKGIVVSDFIGDEALLKDALQTYYIETAKEG